MDIKVFETPLETARQVGNYLVKLISDNSQINIVLSGGTTPIMLFDFLAQDQKLFNEWHKVQFYWSDERCVPPDNRESNYKMALEHLLDKINVPSENIHRIHGEDDPVIEADKYGKLLKDHITQKNGWPVFDLVLLGMGDDGHTASIFPHQMQLLNASEICVVATHPISGQKRISLSGNVINNALHVVFLVTGENKKEKVAEVIKKTGNWKTYPAAFVNPLQGNLHWFLDKAAAGLLY